MKFLTKLSMIALVTTFATGVAAQDEGESSTGNFPIGTEKEVQVGQTYFVEKIGDWDVRCMKVAEGTEPCDIFQTLTNQDGQPLAEISVFHLPAGGAAVAGATIVTPLGTLLPAQLTFEIDGGKPKQYPFNWCEAVGCISRLGFTGLELEMMKKGGEARLTIASISAPNQPLTITISLAGFSDGFSAVLIKP